MVEQIGRITITNLQEDVAANTFDSPSFLKISDDAAIDPSST
jgi:hypothetical protein